MQVKLPKSQAPNHKLSAAKALVNLIPWGGGAIASLIDDYIPASRERAQDQFNEHVASKLAEIKDRIDLEAVNKDDLSELFTKLQDVVSRTNRDLKLRAAANLMANFLLKPDDPAKVSFDEIEHLTYCLDHLSSAAITVLGAARQLTAFGSDGRAAAFSFTELPRTLGQHPDLVRSLVAELDAMNLLHTTEGQISSYDRSHVSVRLTAMGTKFAERFIEGHL